MKIAVISDDLLKEEWLAQGIQVAVQVEWLSEPIAVEGAECYNNLLFNPGTERINQPNKLSAGPG